MKKIAVREKIIITSQLQLVVHQALNVAMSLQSSGLPAGLKHGEIRDAVNVSNNLLLLICLIKKFKKIRQRIILIFFADYFLIQNNLIIIFIKLSLLIDDNM